MFLSCRLCDDHCSWLYGLQKQVGSFSHRNTGSLTDAQRAPVGGGKPKMPDSGSGKHVQYSVQSDTMSSADFKEKMQL
jgi:hypothetical protein